MIEIVTLYKGTDFLMDVTVTGDIDLATATEATAILRKIGVDDITLTKTGGDITINAMVISVRIQDSVMLTYPVGVYELRMTATVGGDILPIKPTPDVITVR